MFEYLGNFGLLINMDHHVFAAAAIIFFGYQIDTKECRPLSDKIVVIKNSRKSTSID